MNKLTDYKHSKHQIIYKNIGFQKKSFVKTVILLTISFALILISLWFYKTLNRVILLTQEKNIAARYLYVETRADNPILLSHENVIASFPQTAKFYWTDIVLDEENQINTPITGTNDKTLKSLFPQQNFDIADYEVIVPSIIITEDGKKLDGKALINKTLNFTIDELDFSKTNNLELDPQIKQTHPFQVKVCGVYDKSEIIARENQFFATFKTVQEMSNINEGNLHEYADTHRSHIIAVDKFSNMEKVSQYLRSEGIHNSSVFHFKTEFIALVTYLCLSAIITAVVFSVIILSFILVRTVTDRKTEIALMKVMGFSDRKIAFYIILLVLKVTAVSALFATVISYIPTPFISSCFFSDFDVKFIFNPAFLYSGVICFIIAMFSSISAIVKALKIQPAVAMREVE